MLPSQQNLTNSWRKHWLLSNVFAEIPIVGSFLKIDSLSGAFYDAGKCSAALTAAFIGAFATNINATNSSESKMDAASFAADSAIMITYMTAYMTTGRIIYNVVGNSVPMLYQYVSGNFIINNVSNEFDIESQPIVESKRDSIFGLILF